MSLNPTNKTALDAKTFDNGAPVADILQPGNRVELTVDTPANTAATNTTPFGFSTAAQANALVANVREIRAALIAVGILKDNVPN
jgi:hypothetical protein